jgi:hypothetical protein
MFRFFLVILCFGLAVGCGAVSYFTHMKNAEEVVEPVVFDDFELVTAKDLITDPPRENKGVQLTDFFYGKLPIGINLDDNKKDWEEVYIPLFPKGKQLKRFNSVCVIYRTDQLKTMEEAEEFFEQFVLEGYFDVYDQDLPAHAFSEMAQKYRSIDYSHCVLISNEKPTTISEKKDYLLALLGFAFFLSIAGWQSFNLLGDMKNRIEREKQTRQINDAAGLGSLFEEVDNKNKPGNNGSFIEKYQPPE